MTAGGLPYLFGSHRAGQLRDVQHRFVCVAKHQVNSSRQKSNPVLAPMKT